ncbi:50S ribosomal protein L17 [Candidatus Uhrbacteria bacterium]|nr:50S ribosomal protein L17 [Candidatus Uhrbacteria bacterium]
MRHRVQKKTLDRKAGPRRALLKNLALQLVAYEKIRTTEAKAKVLRPYVERLITKGRTNTLTARRALLRVLPTETAVKKILEELGPRYTQRAGGYLRITKTAPRQGDGARMAVIEFVK